MPPCSLRIRRGRGIGGGVGAGITDGIGVGIGVVTERGLAIVEIANIFTTPKILLIAVHLTRGDASSYNVFTAPW